MSGTSRNSLRSPRQPLASRWRQTRYRRKLRRDARRLEAREEATVRRLARRDRRRSRREAAKRGRDRSMPQAVSRSLARRFHIRRARHRERIESRQPRTLLRASWVRAWSRRSQRHNERRLERESRHRIPGPWRIRWYRWRAGAPDRSERRRERTSMFIPRPVRNWWRRRRPEQRSRIRLALVGAAIVVVIAFSVTSLLPQKATRNRRRLAQFNSTPAELAAFTALIRPPELLIHPTSPIERLASGPHPAPNTQPDEVCGTAAFESALSSSNGLDSIGRVKCAGLYGIGEIRVADPNAESQLGFFAVDRGGRWRLVATAPKGGLAGSLPEGFPQRLVQLWKEK